MTGEHGRAIPYLRPPRNVRLCCLARLLFHQFPVSGRLETGYNFDLSSTLTTSYWYQLDECRADNSERAAEFMAARGALGSPIDFDSLPKNDRGERDFRQIIRAVK